MLIAVDGGRLLSSVVQEILGGLKHSDQVPSRVELLDRAVLDGSI